MKTAAASQRIGKPNKQAPLYGRTKILLANNSISKFIDPLHAQLERNPQLFLQLLKDPDPTVRKNAAIVISWVFTPMLSGKKPLFNRRTGPIIEAIKTVHEEESRKPKADEEFKTQLDLLMLYIDIYEGKKSPNLD